MTSVTECDIDIDKDVVVELEPFLILLNHTSYDADINEARKNLFSQGKSVDRIPQTKVAMLQHIRPTVFPAIIWNQSLRRDPPRLDPSE